MPRAPKKSITPQTCNPPAPAAPPLAVERGEGAVESFIYVVASDTRKYSAEVEIVGAEGGCITVSESRGETLAETLLTVRFLRNDQWAGFTAIMRAAFAERDRLMPAVALVHEGLYE